jgi:2-oxoacid dehydrogenases acyltransferase (catalytic domain)
VPRNHEPVFRLLHDLHQQAPPFVWLSASPPGDRRPGGDGEIPHYYVGNTVDMTSALHWLHERNRELEISERLVPAALLLKAAALAARNVPDLNGYWLDEMNSSARPTPSTSGW